MKSWKAPSDSFNLQVAVFMNNKPKTLFLIPTDFERKKVIGSLKRKSCSTSFDFHLCGFGPISAAAKTMQLLVAQNPSRVTLLGIAGTYHQQTGSHPVGSATTFDNVICDGIGVGSGEQFQNAASLGWQQWSGGEAGQSIGDVLPCFRPQTSETSEPCDLLTVCSASDNFEVAKRRSTNHSSVVGEDMEAFGVAMACQMFGVELQIVRGFSNLAGDRDKSNWRIGEALEAAVELLLKTQVARD